MIDKLYGAVVAMTILILGGVLAVATLRFLLEIGPVWTVAAIIAGVVIWRKASVIEA